jgi:hypothetical protein
MRQLYYDRSGNQISAADALDATGTLRDGCSVRVPARFRDGMTPLQREIATKRARLTDGNGNCDEFAFSRPGYRIMHDAAARNAREAAYQQYEDELVNSWKAPHGLGNDKLGRRS